MWCASGSPMRRFVRFSPIQRAQSTRELASGASRDSNELVMLEKKGRVGILRLNDPERLNPMTSAMGDALQSKFETSPTIEMSFDKLA
jgi:hypothetical protein